MKKHIMKAVDNKITFSMVEPPSLLVFDDDELDSALAIMKLARSMLLPSDSGASTFRRLDRDARL